MRSTLIASALVLAASAALAQQAPAPAAAPRPAVMDPSLVVYLATNPADLNLTRDQQNRIRQAKETLDRTVTPLHERIQTIRATQAWGNLTVDQRRALADTTRQLAEQVHAGQLTAFDAAYAALTADQKSTLEARREWMRGRRMGPGMMGPGMMGGGMRRGMRMQPGMDSGGACGAPMNHEMAPPQRMDAGGRPPRGGR